MISEFGLEWDRSHQVIASQFKAYGEHQKRYSQTWVLLEHKPFNDWLIALLYPRVLNIRYIRPLVIERDVLNSSPPLPNVQRVEQRNS